MLLHHEIETWKNKNSDNCFNVTMGSNNEAHTSLIHFSKQYSKIKVRFNRDDGLILMKNENGQKTGRIEVIKIKEVKW